MVTASTNLPIGLYKLGGNTNLIHIFERGEIEPMTLRIGLGQNTLHTNNCPVVLYTYTKNYCSNSLFEN